MLCFFDPGRSLGEPEGQLATCLDACQSSQCRPVCVISPQRGSQHFLSAAALSNRELKGPLASGPPWKNDTKCDSATVNWSSACASVLRNPPPLPRMLVAPGDRAGGVLSSLDALDL